MLPAVAADELVISDFGELGPLDLISQHPVIPGDGESGLALVHGLNAIRAEAQRSFEQYLSRFRARRTLGMTTRAAIEQASALAVGLMGPVFSQIDPLQVAEVERGMTTATLYVQRLGADHLKEGALDRLLTGYPSHDFVIDREEASDLLRTVRAPTDEEGLFLTYLEPIVTARRLQGRMLLLEDALSLVDPDGHPDSRRMATPAPTRQPKPKARPWARPVPIGRAAESPTGARRVTWRSTWSSSPRLTGFGRMWSGHAGVPNRGARSSSAATSAATGRAGPGSGAPGPARRHPGRSADGGRRGPR